PDPAVAPAKQRTEALSEATAAQPANPVQPANAPKESEAAEAGLLAADDASGGGPAMQRPLMAVPQDQAASGAAPLATIAPGTAAPMAMEPFAAPAPEPGMMPRLDASGDEFTDFDESPVKVVAEQPVSTFSI